ncbi:MAG: 16S rRNA (cytidine(1402)-2'-O)-methyltransferase [Rhodospirillaceae bacterium]
MTTDGSQYCDDPTLAAINGKLESAVVVPGLHIVSTPIGNLADISLRALATLRASDLIICEDTRVTAKIKSVFAITTPLLCYNDHNAPKTLPRIMDFLKNGKTISLVSDAGTPTISDPGYKLVNSAIQERIFVTSVPGASAMLAALPASGLPTDKFLFIGFLPVKKMAKQNFLRDLKEFKATLIFYESARRLSSTVQTMADILAPRSAVIARELTKKYEEFIRGDLSALALKTSEQIERKGEFVILVGPPQSESQPNKDAVDQMLLEALSDKTLRDAVNIVVKETGAKRKDVYLRALNLKEKTGNSG